VVTLNVAQTVTAAFSLVTVEEPPAPSELTAIAFSTSRINLTWRDNSSNETGFAIERCTGVGCADFAVLVTVGANVIAFSDQGLSMGTAYSYRVRALTASAGNSAYSNTASATTAVDSDNDGLPDDWEWTYFGTLDRDGTGDYDGDGISDLDEYRNGTDPRRPEVLKLSSGFNLIAYPAKVPAKHATCKALLTDLARPDAIDYLDRYNPTTRQFERCTAQGNVDFPIVAGEGYILRLKTAAALPMSGEAVCPPLTLSAGLNLISYPTPPLGLRCYGLLTALGSDRVSTIQRYNPIRGAFESCTFYDRGDGTGPQPAGSDFPIRSGEGLLVHAIAGGEIGLPGCGN
jgi:hypothetical protein